MSGETVMVRYGARERRAMLGFSLLGTALDGADLAIFILFLAPLAAYFHVSVLAMATIQASSYLASIGGALLFGMLADRLGRRWGLSATVALYSLATAASAFSPNYTTLFALRLVAGLGIGGEAGIAITCLNEVWRPARRGAASALLQGMFLVGSAVATLLFTVLVARFGTEGWRWAFGLLGVGAALAAAVRAWMPESRVWLAQRAQVGAPTPRGWARFGPIGLAPLAALMTCVSFAAYAVETYAPAAWLSVYHLTPSAVGLRALMGLGLMFVSYLFFGGLSDRWGLRRAAVAAAVFGSGGFVLYGALLLGGRDVGLRPGSLPPLTLVAFFWMLCAAAPFGVQGAWMAELYPTEVRATGVNVAYYVGRGLGGGFAPLAALAAVQRLGGDMRIAMACGLLGTLGTVLVARRLPETAGRPLSFVAGQERGALVE